MEDQNLKKNQKTFSLFSSLFNFQFILKLID